MDVRPMESEEDIGAFIIEDEDASEVGQYLSAFDVTTKGRSKDPYEADTHLGFKHGLPPLPPSVQQILLYKRQGDSVDLGSRDIGEERSSWVQDGEPRTSQFQEFSNAVNLLRERQKGRGELQSVEVKTYLDIQCFNVDGVAQRDRKAPGALLLMFMFYGRIYDKLVGKQRGVDVNLFAPISLQARCLGFREILDWAQDFRISPERITRRELERIYATVHPAPEISAKFESKINFNEFLRLVAYCVDGFASEPLGRSKIDGSVDQEAPKAERARRFDRYISLSNVKAIQLALHNAYRDVHFWKLKNEQDFEKEARAAHQRSLPQWRVELVPQSRRFDPDKDPAMQYLKDFIWLEGDRTWEEFETPCLDFGTSFVGGPVKRFKVVLTNRQLNLVHLELEPVNLGALRMPWKNTSIASGADLEVFIDFPTFECGEWYGYLELRVRGIGCPPNRIEIPAYMRVLAPHAGDPAVASKLPPHAPRPFSANRSGNISARVNTDPTSTGNLWPRTPGASRPGSAKPPKTLSRPNSASHMAPSASVMAPSASVIRSRPASASPLPEVRSHGQLPPRAPGGQAGDPGRTLRPQSATATLYPQSGPEINRSCSARSFRPSSAHRAGSRPQSVGPVGRGQSAGSGRPQSAGPGRPQSAEPGRPASAHARPQSIGKKNGRPPSM
eukprot:gnl/MRDRNA2_/MRDRNA2_36515_c0_seq1.p1 gnl/MRDRNA2_/MRDRNA2_36515_c0~~gnl/MRDRNA2_/MRDRNA2_36515_c0_seq1.p1  ORF type:complete len:672 (+),score=93.22 gnl/MRDRNA2_/MRDRNA2_36515_c0_seq1:104-2119(+)